MKISGKYNEELKAWEASLSGEVDVYNKNTVKERLELMLSEKNESIILDCRDLSYIDSSGLGVLIATLKATKIANNNFSVINLQPHIYKLFEITGLDRVLDIKVL